VTEILLEAGVRDVIGCDSRGALHTQREDYLDGSMSGVKRWYAEMSNPEGRTGGPGDVIDGTDLFIGLSGAKVMPPEALARMNGDAMVFAMANPNPEVTPEDAAPYARIVATGRSDYPNQINNVLAFPGHLPRRARRARAADHRADEARRRRGDRRHDPRGELREDYIVPSVFNRDVAPAVSEAVARVARETGAAYERENTIGFAAIDAERIRAGD
jgi:malate dehydrogenase (oxaloacetate-decarboxylating)